MVKRVQTSKDAKQRRFPLFLTDQEADAVAEYRWRNRVPSQTEAVRRLIRRGLEVERALPPEETKTATEAGTPIAAE